MFTSSRPQIHLGNSHIYVTNPVDELKTARTDTPQLITERKSYIKMEGREEPRLGTKLTSETNHKREGHHKHGERRGTDPTPNTPDMGDLHWED